MKNLLFLFVMLAFLVACSDDDDKSPKNKYGQFLIEKIVYSKNEIDGVLEFAYNSKNELTKMTLPYNGGTYVFDRNGSNLTWTSYGGGEEEGYVSYGILNENECLVSMQIEEDTYTFIYDASNRLISIANVPYVWEGNNIQSTTDGYYDFVFEYTEYLNNINIDFIYIFNEIMCGFFSGNVGRPNQNLIKSYTVGHYKYELEYEFDGEKVSVVREYYVRDGERELDGTYRLYYK